MQGAYVIPVMDRWLVHAPLSELTALVNRAAAKELAIGNSELGEEIRAAEESAPGVREGPVDPQFFGLIPTRACNLTCACCAFAASQQGPKMDLKLAAAGIDWMADHASRHGKSVLDIHFFGGEPMMAPDVVEVAVHRARARALELGLRPRFEMATNGVYSEEWARFLGDYFDSVVLSFDGFAEVQDRHRPLSASRGTSDQVARTARILSDAPAALCLRICVADDNVGQLAETVDWFCQEFHPVMIDVETLQASPQAAEAGLSPPDPYVFAENFIAARQMATAHGTPTEYAAASPRIVRTSFCPVGNDALILHPDGRISACYLQEEDWQSRGLDLNLGSLTPAGQMMLDVDALTKSRDLVSGKPRCERCFCRWSCAGACHVNHSFPGCSNSYDDLCIQTRLITACVLLEELGLQTMQRELVAGRSTAERLALWPDDRPPGTEAPNA